MTGAVKSMVVSALDGVGGIEYLKTQAKENPTAFLSLIGKVIPSEVHGPGDDGSHKVRHRIEWVIVDPKHAA